MRELELNERKGKSDGKGRKRERGWQGKVKGNGWRGKEMRDAMAREG